MAPVVAGACQNKIAGGSEIYILCCFGAKQFSVTCRTSGINVNKTFRINQAGELMGVLLNDPSNVQPNNPQPITHKRYDG